MSRTKKEEVRGYGICLVVEVGLASWRLGCSKKHIAFQRNLSSVK